MAAAAAADRAASRLDLDLLRARFTPENRLYARVRQGLAIVEPLYVMAVALVLLFTGVSARMRDKAHATFRGRYGRVLVYVTLFGAALFVLDAPFAWFRDFYWEHRFGLSNQSFAAWAAEQLEAAGLDLVVCGGTGLLALAAWIVERAGHRWWVWLGAGTLPVLLAGVILQPLVFDPAFNRFTPLKDVRLRAKIVALAQRAGIPGRRVFEVDRSKQTKAINAYVSGFGPSQRIVLWDTALTTFREDEMLFVMGHEMGHYRLAHIWKGVALFSALSFVVFFGADRIMRWALSRFGARWRVPALHDPAAFPLALATLIAVLFILQPALCGYSRRIEHEADRFGLDVTHSNDAAVRTYIKMAERNRSDPDPPRFVKPWLYTHPTLAERVRFARTYHPWERGGTAGKD